MKEKKAKEKKKNTEEEGLWTKEKLRNLQEDIRTYKITKEQVEKKMKEINKKSELISEKGAAQILINREKNKIKEDKKEEKAKK